jgi:DNA-binding PadR family transcriptional regulator
MPGGGRRDDHDLSLTELAILGSVAEERRHGFAVARILEPGGELGLIFGVGRPAVYRSIERLGDAGLLEYLDVEPGHRGPRRTPLRVTVAGRLVLEKWLWQPVEHIRHLRTEFLMKVTLIERSGRDPGPLIAAQAEVVAPIVAGIVETQQHAAGTERVVALWRAHSARAALQFLEELGAADRPLDGRGDAGP